MRKLSLLIVLVTAYAVYPYWSLYRLGEALEVGNESALKRYVDWPAVRSGLKEDLSGILSRETGQAIASGNGEAALGGVLASAIGNALLEPLLAVLVTPEGLAAIIREGRARKSSALPDRRTDPTTSADNVLWDRLSFAFFTGPATFEAVLETDSGEEVVCEMQLNGMHWQLTRLRLPQDRRSTGGLSTPSASPEGDLPREQETDSGAIRG